MLGFIISVIVVVIGAVVAVVAVARLQKKKLQKRFCVEITNQGNVQSRYELQAEDLGRDLLFQFALHGDSLPERQVFSSTSPAVVVETRHAAPPSIPAAPGGIGKTATKAIGVGGFVATLLTTVGYLLPGSMGKSLLTVAGELRLGQVQASRARQVTDQVSSLKRRAPRVPQSPAPSSTQSPVPPSTQSSARVQGTGIPWVQTPFVHPGETLAVDLLLRSGGAGRGHPSPFRVLSRSVEQENAPQVVAEGSVYLTGGFWTRRFLPYVLILVAAITLVLLAFWLANAGLLG